MPSCCDIQIRDPFILPVFEEKKYYLYGTTDKDCWKSGVGFDAYASTDLQHFQGPHQVFALSNGFWADRNCWAPEVHRYNGKYYMFASFKSASRCRGTQILVADTPLSTFKPISDFPITPPDWECLDGTLYVDEAGDPWIVFCHEWVQIEDGTIDAMKLSRDLSKAVSPPITLFRGSSAPWARARGEAKKIYVTDGPFIHRAKNGALLMLWSGFGDHGYTMGVAASTSGKILGPWEQRPPVFSADGGHGMIFQSFEGDLMMPLHRPNNTPNERPIFLRIKEQDGILVPGA